MNSPLLAALIFAVLAAITLGAAAATGLARGPVRSALAAALCFVGIGLLFIWLSAEFLGFIQLLVYVGAVAVLIVFVILLTRRSDEVSSPARPSLGALLRGLSVPVLLFIALGVAVNRSNLPDRLPSGEAVIEIAEVGREILTGGLLPLFLTGVLLTAALIGGVGLALANSEKEDTK